jgi:acyl-coenzyme A thioesterase PaaI-like protein
MTRPTRTTICGRPARIVVETELRRDDGRLAAKTTQTQAVLTA